MSNDADPPTTQESPSAALALTERFAPDAGASIEQPLGEVDTSVPAFSDEAERYVAGPMLGSGGMGFVRLDRDRRVGRSVARKFLHQGDDAQWVRRFLREARIQGQLEHPAIPPVYDVGRGANGQLYFTMKRLKGVTMSDILAGLAKGDAAIRERFPRRRLLSAVLTVCDALEYAHARGVIHRDLKPANVMLGDYGEVWVLDWGIARVVDDQRECSAEPSRQNSVGPPSAGTPADPVSEPVRPMESERSSPEISRGRLTAPGHILGTMHYISPEQAIDGPLDGRTDLYALGMMLFEILTLKQYRENEGWLRLLAQLTDGKAAHPVAVDPSIEPELDAICARATAPKRAERYASAREMRAALDAFLSGERDADARRSAGARIVKNAAERLEQCERSAGGDRRMIASARTDAMHEALRALALDPNNPEAERFVGTLVDRVTGEPPPAAREEVERARARLRHEGMTTGLVGLCSWLIPVPLILIAGVRDWPAFVIGLALLLTGIALAAARVISGWSRNADGVIMATLVGLLLVLMSGYLGPFVVVPACGNAAAMLFAMHATRNERLVIAAILCTAVLVPFALDLGGLVPPGFEFAGDTIVLHPRLVDIPRVPTLVGLMWVSGSFTVVSVLIVGRMRDRLDAAERRLHVSMWHLRQLFPAAADATESIRMG